MATVDAIWTGGFTAQVIRAGHPDDRIVVAPGQPVPGVGQADAFASEDWLVITFDGDPVAHSALGVDEDGHPFVDSGTGGNATVAVLNGELTLTA